MNLNPATRRKMQIIGWTMVYFVIGLNLYSINRFLGLQTSIEEVTHDTFVATFGGIFGGLLLGILQFYVLEKWLKGHSWGRIILIEAIVSICIIIIIFLPLASLARAFFLDKDTEESFYYSYNYMLTLKFLSLIIHLLILSALYHGMLLLHKQFGPGIMKGLLLGKYLHPLQEKRIFMFLDLKSSTPIAEKLGHIRYSQLLQQCFQDLSEVALSNNAQVYQYVGDEAVLTWPLDDGIKANRCVNLYFDYCDVLESQRELYKRKFDLFPVFTASLHAGGVTVAEIGEYKREIAYHGDVLNTGSRIQGMCGILGHGLLASNYLVQLLNLHAGFEVKDLGEVELRGRSKTVHLNSIEKPKN